MNRLNSSVRIVAELSANHAGRYETALELLRAAHQAGADAVKLQTYRPDTITFKSDKEWFRLAPGNPWGAETLYELYEKAYMPWEWQPLLKAEADNLGIELFSTPFDESAVDFLEAMRIPRYKVASFELIDLPLIAYIAHTGKPMIMSTGMATLGEIRAAVETARDNGCGDLTLLHCVSAYPASPEGFHLRTLGHLAETFGVSVGLSDHSLGTEISIAAVALGATMIEKHVTLDRRLGGPDARFSLEPSELAILTQAARTVEKAMGGIHYGLKPGEEENARYRPSVYAVQAIRRGDTFTRENIATIRPGNGLPPFRYPDLLGHQASRDIEAGDPITDELLL